jgi:hypothetical protein
VMALPYLGLMVVLLTGLLMALWQDRATR